MSMFCRYVWSDGWENLNCQVWYKKPWWHSLRFRDLAAPY